MLKRQLNVADSERQLDALGLRPFTPDELRELSRRLSKSISTRLQHPPTGVAPISMEQVRQIPTGTRGIVAACGGTNWMFAVVTKQANGQVVIDQAVVRQIAESERHQTYESFTGLMAEGMVEVATQAGLMDKSPLAVSIALGFPQLNVETQDGEIDALLASGELPKFWKITDYDASLPATQQPSLVAMIRNHLRERGMKGADKMVILNDAVAVALDVRHDQTEGQNLPVGFVCGTGTNAAMSLGSKQGLVNLEIGHAEIMDQDQVLEKMQQRGWVPDNRTTMEYWTGGAYIPQRVRAALELLGVHSNLGESDNQALISELAKHDQAGDDLAVRVCAQRALQQAGQLVGVQLATVCQALGVNQGTFFVPFEGSVLSKGYKVKEIALETARLLLPSVELKPYEASGLVGAAKLAMLRLFD